MKKQNILSLLKLSFLCSFHLSLLGTGLFIQEVNAQEIEASNLACTGKFKNYLGQEAPEYCRSAEADGGILIDSLISARQKDNSIKVELTLFNRGTADGLVEVYDSFGKLVNLNIIKGNKPPTGLIQSGSDLFLKYPQTFWSRYPLGDVRRELKEQKITVVIPQGGFVNLTKSSRFATVYNVASLALEISQIKNNKPEYVEKEYVKEFLLEFTKEIASESGKNIFKSEPTVKAIFSLDFIDPNKTAEILQSLWEYSFTKEDNPLLEVFSTEVLSTAGNIGIENALDKYILPGLGTLARNVRRGGDAVNTFARAADTYNTLQFGQKDTITLRHIKLVRNSSSSNSNVNWNNLKYQSDKLDNYVMSRRGKFDNLKIPNHLNIKLPNGLIYSRSDKNKIGEKIILHGVMEQGTYCTLSISQYGVSYDRLTNTHGYPATGFDNQNYLEMINLTINNIVKQNSKFYFYTSKGVYLIDVNMGSVSKALQYPKI